MTRSRGHLELTATFIVYSYSNVPRVRNVARHPAVSLHLNSTPTGSNVVTITGRAELDPTQPPAHQHPGCAAKYREGIARKGGEDFSRLHPIALRVIPLLFRVQGERGWMFTNPTGRAVRTRASETPPSARIPMEPSSTPWTPRGALASRLSSRLLGATRRSAT